MLLDQRVPRCHLASRRLGRFLARALRGETLFLVLQLQRENRLEPLGCFVLLGRFALFGTGRLVQSRQRGPFAIEQLPILGLVARELADERQGLLVLLLSQQRVDRLQDDFGVFLVLRQLLHQRGGLVLFARLHQQTGQPHRSLFAGSHLVELLLITHRHVQIAVRFAELDQLSEELRVARVVGEQLLQFRPRVAVVARRLISLREADRHLALLVRFATLTFEPFEQPVELVRLQIQLRQLRHHAEPVFEIARLVERSPIEFDRLARPELLAQRGREQQQTLRFGRVHADGTPQRLQTLFRLTDLEAELREELIQLRIAGRGGEQVAARLNRLLAATELHFELSHLLEVLGAIPPIDGGQLRVGLDGAKNVVLRLQNPRRGHQNRNRLRREFARLRDRLSRFFHLPLGLISASQPEPLVGQRLVRRGSPDPAGTRDRRSPFLLFFCLLVLCFLL